MTRGQHAETQVITCAATNGSLSITFRTHTTRALSVDASASEVRAALVALRR